MLSLLNSQIILTFCRFALGITFTLSFLGKLQDQQTFKVTIIDFKIIPKSFVSFFAWIVLISELLVIMAMLLGGTFLIYGFILAALLLSFFTIALISILTRGIQTSCNCFGKSSRKNVSKYDVARNIGFIVCSFVGGIVASSIHAPLSGVLNLPEIASIGFLAFVIVLILLYIQDIFEILT